MIHRVIQIGRWVVDFLFAARKADIEGALSCLYDLDAPGYIIEQAEELIGYNNGFTYSSYAKRRAVVYIGVTTSGAEFLDSFSHELRHLADTIANSLGIELDSEPPAYLTGDTARELIDVVCQLGCEKCRASSRRTALLD